MPTYGYSCQGCGRELEVFQSMSAPPMTVCPECGGRLRKLLYPVGVQFKGSGFYTTDYRNGSGRKEAQEAKDGGKEAGKGAGTSGTGDKAAKADKPAAAAAKD